MARYSGSTRCVLLSASRNPGMGIRFVNLSLEERERLVDTIRTIAYVRDGSN